MTEDRAFELIRREICFIVGCRADYEMPPEAMVEHIRTLKEIARKWKAVAELVRIE